MSQLTFSATTLDFINSDPNRLFDAIDAGEVSLQELENEFDRLCQRAAFVSGYLSARGASGCGDSGHDNAMKNGQKVCKKVRAAIGYTQP